jgi:hypothetical protein
MKPMDKGKLAAWVYDMRVRDRLLESGSLDPKALERYLAELPDLEGHADSLPFDQPALARGGGSLDGEP